MTPSIFKAYDIRVLYPEEINEELAERMGRGTAPARRDPPLLPSICF
jgi:phosphomannomutase